MNLDSDTTPRLLPVLQQALHAFYLDLDEFRYEALAARFEPEGVWLRQGRRLGSRAEIVAALSERPPTMRIRHVITNLCLQSATADTAEVVAYMTAYRHDDGSDAPMPRRIAGPFRLLLVKARFRRHGDAWLIAEQSATNEFEFA